jgi:general secretion pathway protein G
MNKPSLEKLRRADQGFSLVEVLIAVTIIVLMGGVVAWNVFPELFRSQRSRAEMDISNLVNCVKMYQLNEHRLPHEGEWPEFLLSGSPNHSEPYIEKDKARDGKIVDPWGNPYEYRKLGSKDFEIKSMGPDGQPGGEGDDKDISNKKDER